MTDSEKPKNQEKICRNCVFWKKDYGVWTVTGWTGMDRDSGNCHLKPEKVSKKGNDFCSFFEYD